MTGFRFTRPPGDLRRRRVRLDNIALVPASLLSYREHWQRLANELPQGSILIVTPLSDRPRRSVLEQIRTHLLTRGHQVRTVPAEHFTGSVM